MRRLRGEKGSVACSQSCPWFMEKLGEGGREARDFERQVEATPKGLICPTEALRLYSGFEGPDIITLIQKNEQVSCS